MQTFVDVMLFIALSTFTLSLLRVYVKFTRQREEQPFARFHGTLICRRGERVIYFVPTRPVEFDSFRLDETTEAEYDKQAQELRLYRVSRN